MVRHASALTPDEVATTMQVNFHAPVQLTLALLPGMLERGRGTIVNVSSMGGRLGIPREAAYCASKFALCGLERGARHRPLEHPDPGEADRAGPGRHRHLGPARHRARRLRRREGRRADEVARGIADAIDSDEFEHYLPDLRDVALYKANHIDEYLKLSVETLGG